VSVAEQNPIALMLAITLLGLLVGNVLSMIIFRMPKIIETEWNNQCYEHLEIENLQNKTTGLKLNYTSPSSYCPKCENPIKLSENIPLFSYLLLKGRCSSCKNRISLRYPFIEVLTAVFSCMVIAHFGVTTIGIVCLILTWGLITAAIIDFDCQYLFDEIVLPFLWLGLIVNYFGLITSLEQAFLGAIIGYLSLWSITRAYKIFRGIDGMGNGDFKLMALFGAWLGFETILPILMLSAISASVLQIALIYIGTHKKNLPFAFGPYIALSGWIYMLYGNSIDTIIHKII